MDDSVLPRIEVILTFDKNVFEVPDKDRHYSLELTNDRGESERIGTCDFSEDANGNIVLTCKFDKIVYNRTDVEVSFSHEFLLCSDVSSGEALRPVGVKDKKIFTGEIEKITDSNLASAISDGSIWIIIAVAVVAVVGVAALVIVKKKKPALADGVSKESQNEDEE